MSRGAAPVRLQNAEREGKDSQQPLECLCANAHTPVSRIVLSVKMGLEKGFEKVLAR